MRRQFRNPLPGLGLILICFVSGACHTGQFPDPNSPEEIAGYPDRMMDILRDSRERLDRRVAKNQLTPAGRDAIMARLTKGYIDLTKPTDVTDENAWLYGDLYRDGGMWKEAYALYNRARQTAKTEDRRVNDTLRFARAAGMLGKVKEAIAVSKETFSAPPQEKAPILPAILYEVVPASEGKKEDVELAKLLEMAIKQHQATVVDAESEAGKNFMIARPAHIQKAFSKLIDLYAAGGRRDLARDAIKRSDKILAQFGSV